MTTDNVTYIKRLSTDDAMRIIRDVARDTSKVFLTHHAKERMLERNFTLKQVIDSFQSCRFHKEPKWSLKQGNWRMTVEAPSMDDWIRVGLSLDNRTEDDGESNYMVVITVIRVEG